MIWSAIWELIALVTSLISDLPCEITNLTGVKILHSKPCYYIYRTSININELTLLAMLELQYRSLVNWDATGKFPLATA